MQTNQTSTPSPAAMRAAMKLLPGTYYNGGEIKLVSCNPNISTYIMIGGENKEEMARRIIDRETGIAELRKALSDAFAWITMYRDEPGHYPAAHSILQDIRAILRKDA